VDLHQIVAFDNIMKGTKEAIENDIRAAEPHLEEIGLIRREGNSVQFAGDALDKIYIKYLAREKKVNMPFIDAPPDALLGILLTRELDREKGIEVFSSAPLTVPKADETIAEWNAFAEKFKGNEDPFLGMPSSVSQIYFAMIEARKQQSVDLSRAQISLPWTKFSISWFRSEEQGDDTGRKFMEARREAIEFHGGSLMFENIAMPQVPVAELVQRLANSSNERLRARIANQHERRMVRNYVDKRNVEEAQLHSDCIETLNATLEPSGANNVGYLFLKLGKFDLAVAKLKSAYDRSDTEETPETHLLSSYNLALAEAACGNFAQAETLLDECIAVGKTIPRSRRTAGCLLQFDTSVLDKVAFLEDFDEPDIWHFAKVAREKMKELNLPRND
jgi:tetratricopeptide (TPR) repeat protein